VTEVLLHYPLKTLYHIISYPPQHINIQHRSFCLLGIFG